MTVTLVVGALQAVVFVSVLTNAPVTQVGESKPEGRLKTKVVDALKAVAAGTCPEKLMNAVLLDACEQHLDRMKSRLRELGPIKEAKFRGLEPLPNGGEAEVYRVVFESGEMTWMAQVGPNGKLSVFWSPG